MVWLKTLCSLYEVATSRWTKHAILIRLRNERIWNQVMIQHSFDLAWDAYGDFAPIQAYHVIMVSLANTQAATSVRFNQYYNLNLSLCISRYTIVNVAT